LRDPLEELTGVLANPGELLSLKLHPLQDMLGEENLTKIVHRCCVNVVNKVGVDINRCIMHKYASPPLQFVAGLGPRKALGLMNNIFKRGGKISSRDDLELYMGHCVYTNCAGFIRILDKYFKKNEDIDLLDNTRIHPDDYNLVKKMATDALEREDDEDLINELMKKPKKLDDIDLEAFADELEPNGKPKKRSTLNGIKAEIHDPFSDPRKDLYKDPSPEELFTMLTGETDRTLRNGMLVNAQILAVQPKSIRVKLENGLVGFIKIDNISDDHGSIKDIQQELALEAGMPIFCRILEIQKDRFAVELTCKSSKLSDDTCENEMKRELLIWEPYFVDEDLKRTGLVKKRKKEKPSIIHRKVEHPFFQNVTAQQAETYLADKDVGEVVIRPSSKGTSYLTITWKFYHDIYVHITIREEGKRNPTSIGQILHIGGEKFEDLNEILARYVEPRMAFAQELYEFRNFRQGSQEEIEAQLREKKKAQPSTIPYLFSVSKEHPGVFVLSYLPNTRVRKEFVNVTSEGFRFRRNIFTDPERLVKWFKMHWKEPVPGPTPRPGDIPEPVVDYGAGEMMNDYDINTMNMQQQHPYHQPQQPTWEPQPQAVYSKMIPGQQPWGAPGGWEQPPPQPAPYQNVRPNDRRPHDQRQGNFRGHDRGGRGGGRGGRRDDRPRGGERRGPPRNNEGRDNRNYGRDQRSDSGRNDWTSGNWGSKPARDWDQPPTSNSWGEPQTNSSWTDAPTQSTSSWDAQNNYGGSTSSW
jgi:transcription elongation factor SPT6